MGSSKAKQAKKLMKAKAKIEKKKVKTGTETKTRTSFLYNPWIIKITGSIVAGLILYFLLGK